MMKKLAAALASALFAVGIGGISMTNGQEQPIGHRPDPLKQVDPNYAIEAPQSVAKKGLFHVCSADLALRPSERRESIRSRLKASPRDINRLTFTQLKRGGTPAKSAPPNMRPGEFKVENFPVLQGENNEPTSDDRNELARQDQALALIWGKAWPENERVLHVRFLNTHPSWNPIKVKIEQYAHEWENYANVKFVFDGAANSQIRIMLANDDFSWSNIGTDAKFKPSNAATMHYGWFNLSTPDSEFARTVIHEFGHALGAIHEHQHPDAGILWNKQVVYDYYASADPPWSEEDVDTNLFDRYDRSVLQYGTFDPQSIMMYPISPAFTTNGFSVGWNRVLSALDKSVIAWVYGSP